MSMPDPRVVIRNGQSHVDIVQDGRQVATINVSNILESIWESFRQRSSRRELIR